MPKKLLTDRSVPSLVLERLSTWGEFVHAERVRQRFTAADLSLRMGVSLATLRRLERGDPGAAVAAYLSAFHVLGVMDEVAPALAPGAWSREPRRRVKHPARTAPAPADRERDRDYF